MAISTSNLGLRKPAKTDYVNVVTDLNGNMDIIDSSVNAAQEAVAIMSDGDAHIAVSSGEYLYVRNHSTLAEGLYKATANISANGSLTTSNTIAITKGLGGQVTALNNKVGNVSNCGRVVTSTSDGKASFTMENATQGFVTIGGNAPVTVGMTSGGSIYNSTMPTGYTISQNGSTVTITKTSSVSTSVGVAYIFFK